MRSAHILRSPYAPLAGFKAGDDNVAGFLIR
jgi:hypothetical protein